MGLLLLKKINHQQFEGMEKYLLLHETAVITHLCLSITGGRLNRHEWIIMFHKIHGCDYLPTLRSQLILVDEKGR